jgi:hypothetical protein
MPLKGSSLLKFSATVQLQAPPFQLQAARMPPQAASMQLDHPPFPQKQRRPHLKGAGVQLKAPAVQFNQPAMGF